MFLFKKLVAPFLLPPGLFILVLLLSGVFLIIWHRRKIGIFNLVVGLIFWIFCSAPFSNFLMRGLESEFQIPQPVKGDVIVLLGGGSIDKVPDFSGSGIPTDRMIGRIVTAVRLQKYLNIPIIVSSGKVHKNSSAGALIAKRFLIDLGVEEGKIVIEDKSRDTYENAKYTREICLRNGYKNPILVTSASHLKRSLLSFKKVGLDMVPYPANFRSERIKNYQQYSYLPHSSNLMTTSIALHEYFGILFYNLAYLYFNSSRL
jgi:uncharacterized SAM-binding protein YcdF (DUF218 family)